MKTNGLPPELISLIHHIELNSAGWWDRATDQLCLGIMWIAETPQNPTQIKKQLADSLGVDMGTQRIVERLNRLVTANAVMRVDQIGGYKLTEVTRRAMDDQVTDSDELSARVRNTFISLCESRCPNVDAPNFWDAFYSQMLMPLVRETGARTYEMISGKSLSLETSPRFRPFVEAYPENEREGIKSTVVDFLDVRSSDIRSFVFRLLNSCLLLEAGSLGKNTLDRLNDKADPPSFVLLLDTNFIFSILSLHDNPSNEAAEGLMGVISRIKDHRIRLLVTDLTLSEARRVVVAVQAELGTSLIPPNVARAALTSDVMGLSKRFLEQAAVSTSGLNPKDFFDPYIDDLVTILASKGVGVLEDGLAEYVTRAAVVADLEIQLEYEKRRDEARRRNQPEIEHDLALWHYVRESRPDRVESPLDATTWFVTVDLRLLAFDTRKRGQIDHRTPICIHPATLIQTLQFWVPRTEEFEEALLGNFRFPFLFQEFDAAAERVTVRILEAISRFENAGDLPEDLVKTLLVQKALRQRIGEVGDAVEREGAVRDAAIEEAERLSKLHSTAQDKISEFQAVVEELRRDSETKSRAVEEAMDSLDAERQARTRAEERLSDLEMRIEGTRETKRVASVRRSFAIRWALAPILACLVLAVIVWIAVGSLTQLNGWQAGALAGLVGVLLSLVGAERAGKRSEIHAWGPYQLLVRIRGWLFGAVSLLALGVLANIIGAEFAAN